MAINKINVTITIDKDIWQIAKYKLPCNRSKYIEGCLRKAIYSENEIDTLEKEIEKEKADLLAKEEKLQKLKEFRTANSSNEEAIKKAMKTVFKIVLANDSISEAQVVHISKSNFIEPEVLTDVIKKEGIKITKYTPEEIDGSYKKSKADYNSRR